MANWYGSARTNYFHVKDTAAFRAAMEKLSVEVIEQTESGRDAEGKYTETKTGRLGLIGGDEYGAFPDSYWDEEADDSVDVDLPGLVAEHLAEGEVAIFETIGAEKMRYLTGYALAINAAKEIRQVNLDDIYELAKQLGPNVTTATY